MNPVSIDIKNFLVSEGLGTYAATSGWGIWIGKEPSESESSITTITLRDIGGPKPGHCFDKSKKPMRYDGVQIRVRGAAYETGYAKMLAIAEALESRGAFSVSKVRYSDIQMQGEIYNLDINEKDRPIFVSSWQAFRVDGSAYT